ncbi:MAG: SUMF1/EgtB/PvdO family nonheme iron enzyme, partial [Kiritimatiellae bacterium]|nr:SUMF1/EgtB/PvdO family nonheme iron enzyme [Kiritimatiellia bacterium]
VQWEYACRAGTTTTYSYGNSADGNYMWYESNSSYQTHDVGLKNPNPWGLYDMHGNVWEWCLDWYGTLSYGKDPKGSSSGSNRGLRGGSWNSSVEHCTSSHQNKNSPSFEKNSYGFRLCRTIYPQTTYTVTFDANGGDGEMVPQSLVPGQDPLTPCSFTRNDYAFTGWATNANGSVVYQDLENAELSGDVTLYAVWESTVYSESAVYSVIDLSAGPSAASYPVIYLAEPPEGGFNADAYKTTKLVLRRIEAGSYIMGTNQTDETHLVTLTKPFYIGLFAVTQKQYELVTGVNPSGYKGDKRPVDSVLYSAIRGSSNGAQWPLSSAVDATSFMGKLRTRTGLSFDLPTEAQWEYACRSGTTTAYSYGDSADENYMWYSSNSSYTTHDVGLKSPNPWGLYDMHGNVWERCLDWSGTFEYGIDPKGPSFGTVRVGRGGSYYDSASSACCTSYGRSSSTNVNENDGFRLCRTIYPQTTYIVTFDANGGDGEMVPQSLVPGQDPLTPCSFTRNDYVFTGWATNANGEVVYQDLENVELSGDVTLYAVWEPAVYSVIDLSAGASATSYPVTYFVEPPSGGFNVDAYKTTKLVLKRIEAGSYIMGDDQTNEAHRVTLTKPFYIGIFEVTQKQYQLIMGSNPSEFSGDKCPVENVSYNMIRGSSSGAQWPLSSAVDADSFMGKLRTRTGLEFDLPTEGQWEYACRAGTTTTYSYGDSANGNYMWYSANSSSKTQEVGTKSPNPWGLYDMHGNVCEWCLDWYARSLSGGTDPKGSSSGSSRVRRGGGWRNDASICTSSGRYSDYPSYAGYNAGFRLVRTLSN